MSTFKSFNFQLSTLNSQPSTKMAFARRIAFSTLTCIDPHLHRPSPASIRVDILAHIRLVDVGLVHHDEAGAALGWDLLAAGGAHGVLHAPIAHVGRLLCDRDVD